MCYHEETIREGPFRAIAAPLYNQVVHMRCYVELWLSFVMILKMLQ